MIPIALKGVLESILFVSENPISVDRFCTILDEFERGEIKSVLSELINDYKAENARGIEIIEVAGGYQLRSKTENADYIRRMKRTKPPKFSSSSMETLAIIAYRQPVTRGEIEYLRGVDSGGILKNLLDKKLIRILGKKDIPGKPLIYGTTKEFMEVFSLKDLAALPTLKEIQELDDSEVQLDQATLPLDTSE